MRSFVLGFLVVSALAGSAVAQAPPRASVAITSPADGAVLTQPTVDVTVSFDALKGKIDRLSLLVNGSPVSDFDVPKNVDAGTHVFPAVDLRAFATATQPVSLVARAFQNKNDKKFTDSAVVRVRVQLSGDFLSPQIGGLVPATGSAINNPRPTLQAQVTDTGGSGVDVSSIVVTLDGAPLAPGVVGSGDSVAITAVPASDLAPGSHTFTVNARDLAGNAAAPASSTFQIDLGAPVITISAPPAGFGSNPRPPLSATITDQGGVDASSIVVRLDNSPVLATIGGGPAQVTIAFTPGSNLAEGSHTYSIDARDRAGNAAPTATRSFSIDASIPVLSITAPAAGSSGDNPRPPLSATFTDAGSGVDVSSIVVTLDNLPLSAGVVGPVDSVAITATPSADLAPGLHVYAVTGRDLAGNAAVPASTTFTVLAPAVTLSNPSIPNGGFTASPTPTFTGTLINGAGTGINTGSIVVRLDGNAVPTTLTPVNANTVTLSLTPGTPLSQGPHSISIDGLTGGGTPFPTIHTSFLVDLTPPTIVNLQPGTGTVTNNPRPPISATVLDSGGSGVSVPAVQLILNGVLVPASVVPNDPNQPDQVSVAYTPPSNLADGLYTATVRARDRAGNQAADATTTFRIQTSTGGSDTTPPVVTITAPTDGDVLIGSLFAISATVSDADSGIDVASLRVFVNGGDVTSQMMIVPGPLNGSGNPSSADVSGTATAPAADVTVVVSVQDKAGNATSVQVAAVASLEIPTPPIVPALLKLSGDGQEGLAGKCSDSPLMVRAVNTADGNAPLSGLQLRYRLVSGAGYPAKDRGFVTGEDGTAGFNFIYGLRESANVVEIGLVGFPSVAPVQFTLTTRRPVLRDLSNQRIGPCNLLPSTNEYAGSALPKLLIYRLEDHLGRPMPGETILPFVQSYNGNTPPQSDIGYFMPAKGVTNDQGEVTFGFVIRHEVGDSGPFTLRFQAPCYVADDGEPIHADVAGSVKDDSSKPRNFGDTEIVWDDPAQSGQGQVGVPGKTLNVPLRARFFGAGSGGGIQFKIIEGDGTFEEGTEGFFEGYRPDQNCAKITGNIRATVKESTFVGHGNIKFKLAAGYTHALIAMDSYTDIFLVGPPEVRTVQATQPDNEIGGLIVDDPANPDPDLGLQLEVRTPVGFTDSALGEWESFDEAGASLVNPDAVAPSILPQSPMSFVAPGPEGRYDVWRLNSPVRFVNIINIPGQSVPSGGGMLQAVRGGSVVGRVQLAQEKKQAAAKVPEAKILKPSLITKLNETSLFKVQNLPGKDAKVQWSIQRLDVAGPEKPFTNDKAKKSEVHVLFDTQRGDAPEMPGVSDDPIAMKLPKQYANRRARYLLRAVSDVLPKKNGKPVPLETVVLVDLGDSVVEGEPNTAPTTKAQLNAQFTFYSAAASVNTFAKLGDKLDNGLTALQTFNRDTQVGGVPENTIGADQRLVFAGFADPDSPETAGTSPVGYKNDLSGIRFGQRPTVTTRPIGSVLWRKSESYNLEDLTSVVDHETFHLKQMLGQTPQRQLALDAYNSILDIFVADFQNAPPKEQDRYVGAYILAARGYMDAIDELEAAHNDLVKWTAANSGVSVDSLFGSIGNFYNQGYQRTLKVVIQGSPAIFPDGTGKLLKVPAAIKARIIAYVNKTIIDGFKGTIYEDMISEEVVDTTKPFAAVSLEENKMRAVLRRWK